MSLKEFEECYRNEYGEERIYALPRILERVEATGSSSRVETLKIPLFR